METLSARMVVRVVRLATLYERDGWMLARDAGIAVDALADPDGRVEVARCDELLERLDQLTRDPLIGVRLAAVRDPTTYDAAGLAHFARMAKVYKALSFYRKQLFEDARTKGWPLVRHLMLHYPDDAESWKVDDEFLLGSEILVAPIKNKCFTWPACPYDKSTYLPPGKRRSRCQM